MKKPWTEDEKRYLQLIAPIMHNGEIGELLGRSPEAVHCMKVRMGLQILTNKGPFSTKWKGGVNQLEWVKDYAKRHPEVQKCIDIVRQAKKKGILKQEPCIVCGNPKTDAHHEDYNKPLDVIWLCRRCHKLWHHGKIDKELYLKKTQGEKAWRVKRIK